MSEILHIACVRPWWGPTLASSRKEACKEAVQTAGEVPEAMGQDWNAYTYILIYIYTNKYIYIYLFIYLYIQKTHIIYRI